MTMSETKLKDFNEAFPEATTSQKMWMAEYGTQAMERGHTQGKQEGVREERERIKKELEQVYMQDDGEDTYLSLAARIALFIASLTPTDTLPVNKERV